MKKFYLIPSLIKTSFDVQNLLKNKIADQEELLNSKELNLELLGELYVSRAAF